jgi:hypothetical protein
MTFFVTSVGSGKGADFGGLTRRRRRPLVLLLLRRRLAIAHIMPHPLHRDSAEQEQVIARIARVRAADARRSEVR